MSFRRIDPYEQQIEQFLKNMEQGTAAVANRFEGQRQERLVGEERAYQDSVRVAGFQREDDVRMDERRANQVAAAQAWRISEAATMRQLLSYMSPDSEEFRQAMVALDQLQQPIPSDADPATFWTIDINLGNGATVPWNTLMGKAQRIARVGEDNEEFQEAQRNAVATYLGNPALTDDVRVNYYNNVVAGSPMFTDDMKRMLLDLVGLTDPVAQAAVLRAGRLDEAQISSLNASAEVNRANVGLIQANTARAQWDLDVNRKLWDITYETAQAELDAKRTATAVSQQQMLRNQNEDFINFGMVPTDPEAAARLARSLGYRDTEMMARDGRARWSRIQRMDRIAEETAGLQMDLLGTQVNMGEVQVLAEQLAYDRQVLYGAIREKTNLAQVAWAAMLSGDTNTLRILQGLSTELEYQDALGAIDFTTLMRNAQEIAGQDMTLRRTGVTVAERNLQLLGVQVKDAEVQALRNRLDYNKESRAYNRAVVDEVLTDGVQVAALALAAAKDGNVAVIDLLESLKDDPRYQDRLASMDFDGLRSLAGGVFEDLSERVEYDRAVRNRSLATAAMQYTADEISFIESVAMTFMSSNFTPDGDGNFAGVMSDIEEYVGDLSATDLRVMGTTPEELTQRLYAAAVREKTIRNRSDAGQAMDTLVNAVPLGRVGEDGQPVRGEPLTPQQRRWRDSFIGKAIEAQFDVEVARVIADGLLDGANMDYYKAMLDAAFTQSQIDVNLANARRTELETDLLEAEVDAEGILLDDDTYSNLRLGYESKMNALSAQLRDSYCTLNDGLGDRRNVNNAAECNAIAQKFTQIATELDNLMLAYATGNPYVYGHFLRGITSDGAQQAADLGMIAGLGDVRMDLLEGLRAVEPGLYEGIVAAVRDGVITTAEDFNATVADGMSRVDSFQMEADGARLSVSNIDFAASEWRDASWGQRAGRLASTPEWRKLAMEVANGRVLSESEEQEIAVQFGWNREMSAGAATASRMLGVAVPIFAALPMWYEGPDLNGFRSALNATVQGIRDTGVETSPSTQPLVDGEVNPALMQALVTQESGGKHRGGYGAASPEALTESDAGAWGITQVMPLTGWKPGHNVRPLFVLSREDNAAVETLHQDYRAAQARESAALEAGDPAAAQVAGDEVRRLHSVMSTVIRPYAESATEEDFLRFGREYLSAMLAYFGGDVEKALAAYNAGAGSVNKAVRNAGDNWLESMSAQTKGYVPNIMSMFTRAGQ
jgi:hypothetical protein